MEMLPWNDIDIAKIGEGWYSHRRNLEWTMTSEKRAFALTLDLEKDFSGALVDADKILRSHPHITQLLELLQAEEVKLSVFVVGELLEAYSDVIGLFQHYDCEFHCHSFSHQSPHSNSEEDVSRCRDAFIDHFQSAPLGYRAPDGRINSEGIQNLEKYGFKFDSSFFPSYYPNPAKYLFKTRKPHRLKGTQLLELPNTSFSPLRIMLSISYVKMLGMAGFRRLLRVSSLPEVVVFGSHLHDFFADKEMLQQLPRVWKLIYSRNAEKGLKYLTDTLRYFRDKGYRFEYMSEISTRYRAKLDL